MVTLSLWINTYPLDTVCVCGHKLTRIVGYVVTETAVCTEFDTIKFDSCTDD